jgi:uncharacterized membrane protein YphA (DoxX/SURF4 family)
MTLSAAVTDVKPSKALHFSLWGVQLLLGLAFLAAGAMKTTTPLEVLAQRMPGLPGGLVRFIGVSELAGGLGLILPAATRIKPGLTALAGVGLATVMVLAAIFHLSRGEFGAVPVNALLGGLAAFVAWGRGKKAPIAAR